jgi:hypothetical protein
VSNLPAWLEHALHAGGAMGFILGIIKFFQWIWPALSKAGAFVFALVGKFQDKDPGVHVEVVFPPGFGGQGGAPQAPPGPPAPPQLAGPPAGVAPGTFPPGVLPQPGALPPQAPNMQQNPELVSREDCLRMIKQEIEAVDPVGRDEHEAVYGALSKQLDTFREETGRFREKAAADLAVILDRAVRPRRTQ